MRLFILTTIDTGTRVARYVLQELVGIRDIFWPLTRKPATAFQGWLDSALMAIFVIGVVRVGGDVARRCWRTLHGARPPVSAFGPPVTADGVPLRCG